jgi:hypothetical protein
MSWAAEELKTASLGDKRRNRRLIKIVEVTARQLREVRVYSIPTRLILMVLFESRTENEKVKV